jgi:hypothetical protein
VLTAPDAVQVGQQDRDDHAGFHTFSQEDDERGEHPQPSSISGS